MVLIPNETHSPWFVETGLQPHIHHPLICLRKVAVQNWLLERSGYQRDQANCDL